jgi:hypothetical protein
MPHGRAIPGLFEQLQPALQALEQRRRSLRNAIAGGVLLALLGVGSCLTAADPPSGLAELPGWRFGPLALSLFALACFGLAFVRFLVPGLTGYVNYRARFKKDVIAEIVRAVQPGARYFPDRHLEPEAHEWSRLFRTQLDVFRGDDLVQGFAGETPYEFSELEASYNTGAGESHRTHPVFHGLFFRIDFDRDLAGHTVVQPRSAPGGDRSGMQPLSLGTAFDSQFVVLSTRPDEALSLLDPERRSRLLELAQRAGAPLHLAFAGRTACAALDYGRKLFEPHVAGALKEADVRAMAAPFAVAGDVVRALGLERGRRRPADAEFHAGGVAVSGMEAVAERIEAAGDVGIDELSEAFGRQMRKVIDTAAPAEPLAPPPHEPFARVSDTGAQLEVSYPIRFGAVFATAIWLALTPVLLASIGALTSTGFGQALRREAAQREPRLQPAADLLLEYPTALLLGSLFPWWLIGISLRNRPTRVAIGPDGVSIRRLFRLSPSLLAPAQVRRIDANGRSLCLVRSDRAMLRGGWVMLAPDLRSDVEARWLAAQMSQALRRFGWRAAP